MLDPNDIWGDFFDFNGDGKTDITEEWIAFQIMQECCKDDDSPKTYTPKKKSPPVTYKDLPRIKQIPEVVDDSNYKSLRSDMKIEIVSAIVTFILVMMPISVLFYAGIAAYDEKNSAAWLVTLLISGFAAICGGITIYEVGRSIRQAWNNLKLIKANYQNVRGAKEK